MDFSPLNVISAELRLCIYEFSLCTPGDITIVLEDMQHSSENSHFLRPRTPQPNLLSLTDTCKQIRHEAMPIFLAQNHFKIYADRAIGSADLRSTIVSSYFSRVNQTCFACHAVFGGYASHMRNFTVCMGDNNVDDHEDSLLLRQRLIRELIQLFGLAGPFITMELDLSGGVTSTERPQLCPIIRPFSPVPPIRIELSYARDGKNKHAMAKAVDFAKRTAFESGYASTSYIDFLAGRHKRALHVLEALSQDPA